MDVVTDGPTPGEGRRVTSVRVAHTGRVLHSETVPCLGRHGLVLRLREALCVLVPFRCLRGVITAGEVVMEIRKIPGNDLFHPSPSKNIDTNVDIFFLFYAQCLRHFK